MSRDDIVLAYLKKGGPSTVDEFLASKPKYYVNSWAPVFTRLRQEGKIRRTGEKRDTRYGASAYVLELT